MRSLSLHLLPHEVRVELSTPGGITQCAVLPLAQPVTWAALFDQVREELHLDQVPPPGLRTLADEAGASMAWSVVHFVGVTPQGWGWAFWLPVQAMEKPETCCGFRSQTAAQAAAHTLRTNRDRIRGDLPNAVFEPFALDEAWAFLDTDGQVHATFPTARDAFTAAAKKQHGEPAKN